MHNFPIWRFPNRDPCKEAMSTGDSSFPTFPGADSRPKPTLAHEKEQTEQEKFYTSYCQSLETLTLNSKPIINSLTITAQKNPAFAASVVRAVEHKIYSSPVTEKLPLLYLLDSIVKNVGEPYLSLFTQSIGRVFLENYQTQDQKNKRSFLRVLQTWRTVFDLDTVQHIEHCIFGERIPRDYAGLSQQQQQQIPPPAKRPAPSVPILDEQAIAILANLQKTLGSVGIVTQQTPNHIQPIPAAHAAPATEQPPVQHLQEKDAIARRPSSLPARGQPAEYRLCTEAINKRYRNAHSVLYEKLGSCCKTCGLRFPISATGKAALTVHLDWHFRRNRRLIERSKRPISRDWFLPVSVINPPSLTTAVELDKRNRSTKHSERRTGIGRSRLCPLI